MISVKYLEAEHRTLVDESIRREVSPLRRNHTQGLVLVKFERHRSTLDPYNISNLEDGLEADTFLADVAFALVLYLLRTRCDPADRSNIRFRETELVDADPQETILAIEEAQLGRHTLAVFVVIRILNQLEDEMSRFAVELLRKPVNVSVISAFSADSENVHLQRIGQVFRSLILAISIVDMLGLPNGAYQLTCFTGVVHRSWCARCG